MTKIKLSLPSGTEVEKPVISYFSNGGNYLILDGESVGSMGLPIILVSKVNGNKVEKIIDQTEWQQVKGFLKGIISGGASTYLATPESMSADETYYTQLTLPVASFDALKNAYTVPTVEAGTLNTPDITATQNVSADSQVATPIADPNPVVASTNTTVGTIEPVAPTVSADSPVSTETGDIQPFAEPAPSVDTPSIPEVPQPVEGENDMQPVNMSTEMTNDTPIIDTPVPATEDQAAVNPIIGEEPQVNDGLNSSTNAVPEITEPLTPEIESPVIPPVDSSIPGENAVETSVPDVSTIEENPTAVFQGNGDIELIKQKFMKACEELFDSIASLK